MPRYASHHVEGVQSGSEEKKTPSRKPRWLVIVICLMVLVLVEFLPEVACWALSINQDRPGAGLWKWCISGVGLLVAAVAKNAWVENDGPDEVRF